MSESENIIKKSRRELVNEYKQLKTYMGVTKITNLKNGKIFIAAYPNLKNKWLTLQSQLASGMHISTQLQTDWNHLGPDAFCYEVLEEKDTEKAMDIRWEVKQMEKHWLEKLRPYGERGYNRPPKE